MEKINTDRNYGIDLLRIFAMIMIVTLHIIGHGGILDSASPNSFNYEIINFIRISFYCAVNCYALISGYVGIDTTHNTSHIFKLYIHVCFYTILITSGFYIFCPGSVGLNDIVKSLFPFAYEQYWYYTSYFAMAFFIPFMNQLINNLEIKQIKKLLITIIFIFSIIPTIFRNDLFETSYGYNALWLGMLYLSGGCLNKLNHITKTNDKIYILTYVLCVVITWIGKSITSIVKYTSPTILLAALALIMLFANMQLQTFSQKLVAFFAPLSFSVYLIHDNTLIRQHFMTGHFSSYAALNPLMLIISIIGTAIGIWLICSLIDLIRFYIFKLFKTRKM